MSRVENGDRFVGKLLRGFTLATQPGDYEQTLGLLQASSIVAAMKVPESGMPEEQHWESLFDIPVILERLEIGSDVQNVAELGCGYGTFTIPVAQRIAGQMFTFDIEAAMIKRAETRAAGVGLTNVRAELRDVLTDGFGLPDESCDACLLFNILHCPAPETLVHEAGRLLRPGGRVLVIHWRSDVPTPRGPPLVIRPRPEHVQHWARGAGLTAGAAIELPPWHFGVALRK